MKILRNEYTMTDKNIHFIKTCENQFFNTNLENDFLYKCTIDDVLKDSISKLDYKLNWKNIDTHRKLWFLTYILIPINEAKTYKDLFLAVKNQNIDKVMRNSILHMFNTSIK